MAVKISSLLLALLLLMATVPARAQTAELISADPVTGKSVAGESLEPALSSDGRFVVFSSTARLTADDTNGVSDIYLRDRDTGALERLSDDRGGDQPRISGTGRKIVFRALDAFPKLRLVDREFGREPRTISYPFGGGRSFRSADSAAMSPDGRFVAFPFRPIPGFSNSVETQLCVNDTTEPDRVNLGNTSITNGNNSSFLLRTLGRSAFQATPDQPPTGFFFIETSEALAGLDTNGALDIYRIEDNGNFLRVSADADGQPTAIAEAAGKGAHDPVLTGDGDTLFFISERALRVADDDGGATIYRSTSTDGFSVPTPILLPVRPLALGPQATGNGDFLVFLGQPKKGAARPYLLNTATATLTELARSAPLRGGAPAISANHHFITYATADGLGANDRNRGVDIALVQNPELAQPPAFTVTLSAPGEGSLFTTAQTIPLGATASSAAGGVALIALEVDGFILDSRNGASFPTGNFALGAGVHRVRALAFAADGRVTATPPRTLIVRQSSAARITGLTALQQSRRADGSVDFTADLRIDNLTASQQVMRVIFLETTPGAEWEFFGSAPNDGENRVLAIQTQTLPAGMSGLASVQSNIAAPQVLPDENGAFQGSGRRVVAKLQLGSGAVFFDTGSLFTVLEVVPRLDENTPGPNGGVPALNGPDAAPFNPALLTDLAIVGRTSAPEKTTATYRANAIYGAETKPCTPVWSVVGGGNFASISPTGILTFGDVPAPRTFQVRAAFGGIVKELSVTVQPVSPIVSISASDKVAAELAAGVTPVNGGAFKLLRSPVQNSPLTVSYTIAGTAFPTGDYTPLSGTATFAAGASSVVVPAATLDDAFFEGSESITVTLAASEEYRLAPARTATVSITDDEPVPDQQPDAIIGRGKKAVGAFVFSSDSTVQASPLSRLTRGKTATFALACANRGTVASTFTVSGAGDFLGFTVRYLEGKQDVTASVLAGTYEVTVGAGASAALTLRITPTDATPVGSSIRCPVRVRETNTGFSDIVEAVAQRIR